MLKKSISIDTRLINAAGIGTYLRNLLPRIILSKSNTLFYLLGDIRELESFNWSKETNVVLINCVSPIYSFEEQIEIYQKIPRDTLLFWSPHYNIPLFYRGKLLVTVHDLFHIAMPQFVKGYHKQLYAKIMFKAISKKANSIISVSDFTKNEFNKFVGKTKQEIHAIHNGVDESWFSSQKQKDFHHKKPFLLFVGNIKPHKNLGSLLDAFKLIMDIIPHDLIILGKKEGFITGDSDIFVKALEQKERVHFFGEFDNDSEIFRQFYLNADVLILPSFYESFGLPPLEAMASGCPAIVSNVAALPEIYKDSVLYCNPYDYKDIAEKIFELINDNKLRDNLRQKGFERAKQLTWESCAQKTIHVIQEVLK